MRKSLFLLVLLSFVVSGNFAQEKVIERPLDVYYMEGDAPWLSLTIMFMGISGIRSS